MWINLSLSLFFIFEKETFLMSCRLEVTIQKIVDLFGGVARIEFVLSREIKEFAEIA